MPKFDFLTDVDQEAKLLSAEMKDVLKGLSKQGSGPVSRHPEQTLDSVLMTADDVDKIQMVPDVPLTQEETSDLLFNNDVMVRNNQADDKKEHIVNQRNLQQDFKLQEQIRDSIEAAIASPEEADYQQHRLNVITKVRELQDFQEANKGGSTSLLDVISDLSIPSVQNYGARRDNWIKGYVEMMGIAEGNTVPFGEDQVNAFLDFFSKKDKLFGNVAFTKTKQDVLSISTASSRRDVAKFRSAVISGLTTAAKSDIVQTMAEHPFITSAILDATIVLTPMLFAPFTGGASALVGLAARKALIKKFGKLTVKQLITKLGVNKKLLAERLLAARLPAMTQIGLGLGAVYVAGEMLEDGSSKTAAFLTEVFGPAGVIVFLNLSKSGGLAVLRNMAKNNQLMFKKLNEQLAKRSDILATEMNVQMKMAIQTQDEIIRKTTKEVADDIALSGKSPMADVLARTQQVDKKAADNIVGMIDGSLKGDTPQADAFRQIIGLDGNEILAATPRLRENVKIFLHSEDDIDTMVDMLTNVPELGSAFRGVGHELDNTIRIFEKELASASVKEVKTQLKREIAQAKKLRGLYTSASSKFNLKAFDASNTAFMQTPQARLIFGTLEEFQGLNGKILYKQMAEQVAGDAVEIQGKTYKYINTTLRQQEGLIRREHTFGIKEGVWADSGKSFIGRIIEKSILSPSAHFRTQYRELILTVARATENQRVMSAQMGEAWRGINKALTRPQRKELANWLAEGNHTAQVFQPVKGGMVDSGGVFHTVSREVVDAYQASRNLFDATWRLANLGVVKGARAKGFQLLDETIIVQPRLAKKGFVDSNGVQVNEGMVEEGYQIVKIFDVDMNVVQEIAMSPKTFEAKVKPIADTFDMLGYHKGFAPIIYKGDWRVASIRKDDDGIFHVKTEAIAETPKEAKLAEARMREMLGVDDQTMFISVRNNVQPASLKAQLRGGRIPLKVKGEPKTAKETVNSFIKTLDTDATLQKMSDEELDQLAKAIADAGLGKDVADDLVSEARYFSGPRHTRARATERPRSAKEIAAGIDDPKAAEMMDVGESLPIYFDAVAKHANVGEIAIKQQDKFLKTYGRWLENPRDWTSKVQIKKAREEGTTDEAAKALEAWHVQHQLKVMGGMQTAEQAAIDSWTASFRDRLIAKGSYGLANKMDAIANSAGITAQVRNMTAKGIFGLWNASHYVIQASGMLFTLGRAAVHNPIDIQRAMKTSLKYMYGRMAKKTGMPIDEETKFFIDFVDQSGYLNNVNYVALDDLVGHNTTGVARLFDASAVATKKGEATQRLFAMSWNLHRNIRLIKAGKHPLGFKEADITSLKFRDHIKNEADLTAFNMSKVNQPLYAQGFSGLTFQFKQIMTQMAQLYFGIGGAAKGITKLERLGIWATTVAALGPKAVPFSETLMAFVDNSMATDIRLGNFVIKEGNPVHAGKLMHEFNRDIALFIADNMKKIGLKGDEKYWRRWAEGGFVKAATGGAVDFVDRATLQLVTNTYYDNIEYTDALGPGMNVLIKMISGSIEGAYDFALALNSEDGLEPSDVIQNAKKAFGVLGGARNILSTIEALVDGKVTTRSGRAIIEGLSLSEIMNASVSEKSEKIKDLVGVASGLPSERQKGVQKEQLVQQRQKQAWDEWSQIIIRSMFRSRKSGDMDATFAILGKAMDEIIEYRPNLMSTFQKGIWVVFNTDPNETVEDQNRRLKIIFGLDGTSNQSLF